LTSRSYLGAGPPVHDDRVRRALTAPDLDKLWLAPDR
jgi:hypothetical protein